MALFEEITGLKWNGNAAVQIDQEDKITEFNYEKFLTPEEIEGVDT